MSSDDLFKAVDSGDLPLVKELIEEKGVDIESRDLSESTPLIEAAAYYEDEEHLKVMEYLLERGANVHACNKWGWMALHLASDPASIRLLLSHGAFVDARGKNCSTPLMLFPAREASALACTRELLENDADVSLVNTHGQQARDRAPTPSVRRLIDSCDPSRTSTTRIDAEVEI